MRHVADRAGWKVDLHQLAKPEEADFVAFYESADADVLWIISHGEHDPFTVERTGLVAGETLISLGRLQAMAIPEQGRRLLVINACSGATTQACGGVARIGIAATLATRHQAVVGHLWPVHWSIGFAFGALLAEALRTTTVEDAFFTATAQLADRDAVLECVRIAYPGLVGLLDRLERTGEDFASPTSWGSPVLLV